MRTEYPASGIIQISKGGTGANNAADARRNLAVPANVATVGETSVYHRIDDQNAYHLHVRHDFDDQNALEIVGNESGLRYHVKENGIWTTKPADISSGGTGATTRRLAAANLGLELVDGQELNRTAEIAMGFISNSSQQLQLQLPLGLHTYGVHSFTVNSLHGVLRGVNGYLDNINTDRDFTKSPFSYKIYFKHTGMLILIIDKTSAFTNVVNNTPVSALLTYDFVFRDAYPT